MIERIKDGYLRMMTPVYIFGLFYNPISATVCVIALTVMVLDKWFLR